MLVICHLFLGFTEASQLLKACFRLVHDDDDEAMPIVSKTAENVNNRFVNKHERHGCHVIYSSLSEKRRIKHLHNANDSCRFR